MTRLYGITQAQHEFGSKGLNTEYNPDEDSYPLFLNYIFIVLDLEMHIIKITLKFVR
jgi:hypothetical protein